MNKSDIIFGVARENAPPRQHVPEDTPVLVPMFDGEPALRLTYAKAQMLHYELGQTLARMMRDRGSSKPPGGDIGGTPAALQEAA